MEDTSSFWVLSQPTLRQEGDVRAHGCVFQGRKARGVTTNIYMRKTSKKPKRCGLRTLSVKGLGVVFTHGERISTPRVCHKGRQPLIECARHDFIFMYFPFLCFFIFLGFLCFLLFWGSTRVFPSHLRIPQLRWENQTYKVLSELNVG